MDSEILSYTLMVVFGIIIVAMEYIYQKKINIKKEDESTFRKIGSIRSYIFILFGIYGLIMLIIRLSN